MTNRSLGLGHKPQFYYSPDDGASGDVNTTPGADNLPERDEPETTNPEKLFTQAQLEAAIKDRLERQRRKLEADEARKAEEVKRAALAEEGKFKELFEAERARAEKLEADLRNEAHRALRRKAAKAGGLDHDDDDLVSRLRGETEEELVADAKNLAIRFTKTTKTSGGTPAPNGRLVQSSPTGQEAPKPTRPIVKF